MCSSQVGHEPPDATASASFSPSTATPSATARAAGGIASSRAPAGRAAPRVASDADRPTALRAYSTRRYTRSASRRSVALVGVRRTRGSIAANIGQNRHLPSEGPDDDHFSWRLVGIAGRLPGSALLTAIALPAADGILWVIPFE